MADSWLDPRLQTSWKKTGGPPKAGTSPGGEGGRGRQRDVKDRPAHDTLVLPANLSIPDTEHAPIWYILAAMVVVGLLLVMLALPVSG